MTASENGWQEVADNFTALGRRLRERVREPGDADGVRAGGRRGREGAPSAGDAVDDLGATGGAAPVDDAAAGAPVDDDAGAADAASEAGGRADDLKHALQQFTEAAERLGDRLAATARDEGVRTDAQQAVRSLGDALRSTFSELGGEARRAYERARGSDAPADGGDAEQPPTGPAALPPTPPPANGGGGTSTTDGAP